MLRACPYTSTYRYTVPSDATTDMALLRRLDHLLSSLGDRSSAAASGTAVVALATSNPVAAAAAALGPVVGYVSDERYLAVPGVHLEIRGADGQRYVASSTATGAVCVDLPDGTYEVALNLAGYGAKRSVLTVPSPKPHHFRILKDQLLGYVWPMYTAAGGAGEFRCHSPAAYKLSLWRYGERKVHNRKIGWFDEHGPRATVQVTPDGDYTQTGVKWNSVGFPNPQHKQYIQAPEKTGLYFFHAEAENGDFFSFPWIVSPPPLKPDEHREAKVALLLANMNWNAYNNFGGRSNYIHPDKLPEEPTMNARMELLRYTDPKFSSYSAEEYKPLSMDRPSPILHIPKSVELDDPIEGRAACHVVEAEWRVAGWLEREGISHDIYAESQLDDGTLVLDEYKVLLITTHPEYWTRSMFFQVKEWVDERGGRLIYLGGNGVNCEVTLHEDHALIYHNGTGEAMVAGGFESRMHMSTGVSEASLLGVVYTEEGVMTAAPYEVLEPEHWVFSGTGLAKGSIFGAASFNERIPGGASGHETDKISPSSPPGIKLLAKGTNPLKKWTPLENDVGVSGQNEGFGRGGGAEMVLYETSSGGGCFSAGSITWPTALLCEPAVGAITRNVIERFSLE